MTVGLLPMNSRRERLKSRCATSRTGSETHRTPWLAEGLGSPMLDHLWSYVALSVIVRATRLQVVESTLVRLLFARASNRVAFASGRSERLLCLGLCSAGVL
jgi:hypothetical protein